MYQVNNLVSQYLIDLFRNTNLIHAHNTRYAENALTLPKPNSNSRKKSFSYRGAEAWNNLSLDLNKIDTLSSFKRKIALSNQ